MSIIKVDYGDITNGGGIELNPSHKSMLSVGRNSTKTITIDLTKSYIVVSTWQTTATDSTKGGDWSIIKGVITPLRADDSSDISLSGTTLSLKNTYSGSTNPYTYKFAVVQLD